jgi:hypothetical protein
MNRALNEEESATSRFWSGSELLKIEYPPQFRIPFDSKAHKGGLLYLEWDRMYLITENLLRTRKDI